MGRISLELVPRSERSFREELITVKEKFPCINTLNIPDILKFDIRIPPACEIAVEYFPHVIPHLRAVAFDRRDPFPLKDLFARHNINEVLVILGDNPGIVSKSADPCTSIDLIRKIKQEIPDMKVYAGIDQWRQTFREEMGYIKEKLKAGADGFFTQPFFDTDTMKKYAGELSGIDVFWGLAPVIRESSKNYWETKNSVRFPADFSCTMDWNRNFALRVLELADEKHSHVYFCPITVDFVEYLTGII